MTRPIKFRAWIAEDKAMLPGETLSFWFDTVLSSNCNPLRAAEILGRSLTLMQFTGLLDKNGKEIYEGDLLQTSNDGKDGCDVWDKEENGYSEVYWDDESRCWNFKNWSVTEDRDSIYDREYCEVIGNIYEHPKLINK